HKAVQHEINTKRALINPFGRLRRFFDRPGDALYREAYANIPQSTVKDRLIQSLLTIRKVAPDVKYKIRKMCNNEAHDALTFSVRHDEVRDFFSFVKPIMETPIDFNACSIRRDFQLVIPCDCEVGENLKD